MRLSDLLGAEVLDRDDRSLGRVRDVRLVQDGPIQGSFGAGLRVEGMVVGRVALASRLGYDRHGVDAPWLLAAIARRLHRHSRYVLWSAVSSIDGRSIRIDSSIAQLSAPDRLHTGDGS